MTGLPTPPRLPGAHLLARAALALYPPAWRARYGEEVLGLLDESGGGLRGAVSLAWRAAPAWVWPPGHLHDRPARMRASLASVLTALAAMSGLGLVFAQLTQFQGALPPDHPVVAWCYAVFDAALAASAVVLTAGSLPLWLLMLRRARRERKPRVTAYLLLLPMAAAAAWLVAVAVTARAVGTANGVGPWWFFAFTLAGFAAAGAAAAGPGLALRRLRPRGPAVRLATLAATLAVAMMVLASLASTAATVGLYRWAGNWAGYHSGTPVVIYLALVAAAGAVAVVSAARGARAALAAPGGC